MKKSSILKRFSKLLVNPSYPKRKAAWNIKGRLKNWIIVDMKELSEYLINNHILKVHINDLITNTDWTIIIPKKHA